MRHEAATILQLKNDKNGTSKENMANHLGHDLHIHEQNYKLPLLVIEKGEVGNCLLSMVRMKTRTLMKIEEVDGLEEKEDEEPDSDEELDNYEQLGNVEEIGKNQNLGNARYRNRSNVNFKNIIDSDQEDDTDADQTYSPTGKTNKVSKLRTIGIEEDSKSLEDTPIKATKKSTLNIRRNLSREWQQIIIIIIIK